MADPFADIAPAQASTKPTDPFADIAPAKPDAAPARSWLNRITNLDRRPEAPPFRGSVLQPFEDYLPTLRQAATAHAEGFADALTHVFTDPGVLNKTVDVLATVGNGAGFVFAPVEALGQTFIGNPIERQTGVKGLGSLIGDTGSVISQLFFGAPKASTVAKPIAAPRVVDEALKAVSPSVRTAESQAAAASAVENNARRIASFVQTEDALKVYRSTVGRLAPMDRFQFIDNMEQGAAQASPELDAVAKGLRDALDQAKARVASLGKQAPEMAIQNYFPHIWKDPVQAQKVIDEFGKLHAKPPLRGSMAFTKQRSIDSIAEGLQRGLVPVTDNPIDLVLLKIGEMDKFYYGTKLFNEMKTDGLVSFVKQGDRPPPGFQKINDRVAQVYRPVTPQQAGVDQPPARPYFIKSGEYWAPEPVATVLNNYLSTGLRGNAIYDTARHFGNALNMAQLGLSGFHATFVTLDTMASKLALALQQASRGAIGPAAKSLAELPVSMPSTIGRGAKLRQAYLNPGAATPEMQKMVDAVLKGGGRTSMDTFYRATASGNFVKMWKSGEFTKQLREITKQGLLKAPVIMATKALETTMAPLMEYVVPRAKLGVFYDMARDWMSANPMATVAEQRAAFQGMWDSVDNRLGQMAYDNLFWSKTTKDLAFIAMRSVGWNVGTLRELGGAIVDAAQQGKNIYAGKGGQLTRRMAYAIAMPMTVATAGAMIQYLYTGKPPETTLDYFFPRTGRLLPNGKPQRVMIPSYMKDVIEMNRDPLGTMGSKVNPEWQVVAEMLNNRDFYGAAIADPNDPGLNQLKDWARWTAQQFVPFTFRQPPVKSGQQLPQTTKDQVLQFFGIRQAPNAIVDRSRIEQYEKRLLRPALKKKRLEEMGQPQPKPDPFADIAPE